MRLPAYKTNDPIDGESFLLETAKDLAQSSADGEAFMAAMQAALPTYSSMNYWRSAPGLCFRKASMSMNTPPLPRWGISLLTNPGDQKGSTT